MNEWELWRQDDNGARFRIRAYGDRVHAFAGLLVIESGMPHKQLYWVEGPRTPACPRLATAADRVEALSEGPAASPTAARGPSPTAFLAAFRQVGVSLRDDGPLSPDTIVAVFRAAWDTASPGLDPATAARDDIRALLARAAAALRTCAPEANLRWPDLVDLVAAVPR